AKGICILLVVLFHFGYLEEFPAIQAMRMPLYFILSGLFYKDYESILSFMIRKINRLVIPFLFFGAISLIFLTRGSLTAIKYHLIEPFIKPSIINLPIWFLLCLFWVNLIYRCLSALTHKTWVKCSVVIIIGVLGRTLSYYHIYLPLFISSAFSAMPFYFIGILFRKLPILYKTGKDNLYLGISLFFMAGAILYCRYFNTPHLETLTNIYTGSMIEIYLISVVLVIGLLLLCKAIRWIPIISYLGRYSIIVLGFHYFYETLLLSYFTEPSHNWRLNFTINTFEALLLTLLFCWISIPFCRKFIPFFTAQTDLIKRS
ncbi:MAG: acyltransferase, partial [Muribaculaceae bacterium]|nr:acyltransferase [Muribaculaceae bacterium]